MQKTRTQKEALIKEIAEKIQNSKAVVFSDFKGLSVKEMTALRRELRGEGVEMKVLKKTLLALALRQAGMPIEARKLEGQIAVAISPREEIAAAKIIAKAAKSSENLKIVGGFLGSKPLSPEEVEFFAKLPSQEELLAKLVRSLKFPLSGLVQVLGGNLRGLVCALKAIGESKN